MKNLRPRKRDGELFNKPLSSHYLLKNQNITNAVHLVIRYLPSTSCVAGATLGPLVKQTHTIQVARW